MSNNQVNSSTPPYNYKLVNSTGHNRNLESKPSNLELKKKLLSSGYGYIAESNINSGDLNAVTFGTSQGSNIKSNTFLKGSKTQANTKITGKQSNANSSFNASIQNTNNSYLVTNPTTTSNYITSGFKIIGDDAELKERVIKNMKQSNSGLKLGPMPQAQNFSSSTNAGYLGKSNNSGHNSINSNSFQINFPNCFDNNVSKNNNFITSGGGVKQVPNKSEDKYNYIKQKPHDLRNMSNSKGGDKPNQETFGGSINQQLPDANNSNKYSRNHIGNSKSPNQNFNTYNHTYLTPASNLPSNVSNVNVNVNHIRIDLNNEKKNMTYHTETLDDEKHQQDPRLYNQSKMSNISTMSLQAQNKRSESGIKDFYRERDEALLNLEVKLNKIINSTVSDSRLSQNSNPNPMLDQFKMYSAYKKVFEDMINYVPEYSKLLRKLNTVYNETVQNMMLSYNEAQAKINEADELRTSNII